RSLIEREVLGWCIAAPYGHRVAADLGALAVWLLDHAHERPRSEILKLAGDDDRPGEERRESRLDERGARGRGTGQSAQNRLELGAAIGRGTEREGTAGGRPAQAQRDGDAPDRARHGRR